MIVSVVRAGWMNLRRDRAALMLSFVVPIVFFSIFAGIFGAQRRTTQKIALAVADEDRSDGSRQLIEALRREEALRIIDGAKDSPAKFNAKSAEAYVRGGDAPVALVIPKGFGASGLRFGPQKAGGPTFRLFTDSADPIAPQVASGLLQKTVMTALPERMITGGVEALDRWSGGLTPQQRTTIDRNV